LLRPKAPKRYPQTIWPVLLFHVLHYCFIYLVGPVVGIVSVERMIVANGLTTPGIAGSAGQIIALFTGICSMCLTIWECGHLWQENRGSRLGSRQDTDTRQMSLQDMEQVRAQNVESKDKDNSHIMNKVNNRCYSI
jgi:hypothetical protein